MFRDARILIRKQFTTYYNKEKTLEYLHLAAPIAAASDSQELYDATKVVENFQNPPLPEDESSQNDTNSTPGVQKYSITPEVEALATSVEEGVQNMENYSDAELEGLLRNTGKLNAMAHKGYRRLNDDELDDNNRIYTLKLFLPMQRY